MFYLFGSILLGPVIVLAVALLSLSEMCMSMVTLSRKQISQPLPGDITGSEISERSVRYRAKYRAEYDALDYAVPFNRKY